MENKKLKKIIKSPINTKNKKTINNITKNNSSSNNERIRTFSGTFSNFNESNISNTERFNKSNNLKLFKNQLSEEGEEFEGLFQRFKDNVLKEMRNKYNINKKEYNKKFRTVSDLENVVKNTKFDLENTNENNLMTFNQNNKLYFENKRVKEINSFNKDEISSIKSINEKIINQINKFDKNTREKNFESTKLQKDLEIARMKCKEISNDISVIIVEINSGKSGIINFHSKIQKLKKQLSKFKIKNKSVSG